MRRARVLSLLLLASFAATPALAIMAPLSEQELTEKSDLVALVRVISVTCTSVYKDHVSGSDLCFYLGKLKVIEVKKGDARKGNEVQVAWQAYPESAFDLWAVNYYPGEEVWTHLMKQAEGKYASTSFNARGEVVKPAPSYDLPIAVGQTIALP